MATLDFPSPRSAAGLRRISRRRAAVLIGVHLLIGLHIAHWKLHGRTLAPLELNEVMHTLELGVVTAGFLLMATAVVSVLFFGRFFCSWGCHLLALQDLAAAMLGRLGIRPVPFRSRALRWIAAGAAFYMFVWPQVARLLVQRLPAAEATLGARPDFRLRVLGDGEGWASFLTNDFARNLPGPGITLLTFVVCGLVAVWLLGTRAFCRNLCPYGAVFSLADRFARRRIVLAGDCTACGRCTAVCDSGISVFEEVQRHGAVTSGRALDVEPLLIEDSNQLLTNQATMKSRPRNLPADQRRAATVEAVIELAAEHNPGDITTAAIAGRMNLTQGALFRHFASKEAVWEAVMEWVAERLLARVDQATRDVVSPLAALEAAFLAHVEFVSLYPGVPRMLFGELQRAEDTAAKRKVRELLAQYGERLAGLVEAGKAAGEVTAEIGTGAAVAHFIGTVQGLVMQSLLAGDPERMRAGAANAFAIYRRGIAGVR